ncbi:MAG: hypothetical protein RLZ63_1792 [Pseudomonadota bacterium]|jgi:predicted ABC-type ATPase
MSQPTARLRMFAGPNGSGKSTIKDVIPAAWLGVYVNADEIEKNIRQNLRLDLGEFGLEAEASSIRLFLQSSALLAKCDLLPLIDDLHIERNLLEFDRVSVNSYWASVISDFIRHQLLQSGTSFTFETVMSSPDKVDFLCKAQTQGFKTYLYYVATEDCAINIERVRQRVANGGHPVAVEKIVSRYERSLGLLMDAVNCADRAYIFDNSSHERVWIAEANQGLDLEMKSELMPNWFKTHLWDKFDGTPTPD